ncbi:MAG: vitamin K epoxide reductase family protein [Solirubrobacterales bacterium]
MPGERTLRAAAAALALCGIAVATYIAIADAGSGAPACLADGHGCETVASSRYSHLAGIEVELLGVAGYVALLLAAIAPGDPARIVGLGLALVGFGFSAYLTYVELFVIDAICQWCVVSAGLMTLLLVANIWRTFGYAGHGSPTPVPRGNRNDGSDPASPSRME